VSGPIRIRHADASQEQPALQAVAADVGKVLTPNEEILYVAMQNETALSLKKDAAVATSNRLILYRPAVLGRVTFDDLQWQDVQNVSIDQGMLSTALKIAASDGRVLGMDNLDKDQAKRLYGIAQQMEQEWREKRRAREMEEARARSGGVHLPGPGPAPPEDPVAKLAKAKQMLDQGLISEAEYEALKARILGAM
jgi:PH (Pleckstrin Homology) domain-containing protein/putative oligomerization/nucleic acid binding protein